jgi:hypothetical protein
MYFESWLQILRPLHFTSQTLKEFWDLKKSMRMGLTVLNPSSAYARLAWPPIPIGQARKLVFTSPTPLLVGDNVNLKNI